MQFKAHYIKAPFGEGFWITIHADNLNEADKIHRNKRRRGYICGALIESQYCNKN